MNCWEILGIAPTRNRSEIERAYNQQSKFASAEEAVRLDSALQQALSEAGYPAADTPEAQVESARPEISEPAAADQAAPVADARELSDSEHQVVREVVIQVQALLNDQHRSSEVAIWRAILCEPPADQPAVRNEIGQALEHQLRPLADNGALDAPVAGFLGDWFGWYELRDRLAREQNADQPDQEVAEQIERAQLQMTNFWPAVIGWIAALVILTALFGGFGG